MKPSKSALKKAARQARLEKKQQQRADARKRREEELQRSLTPSPTPPENESTSQGLVALQPPTVAVADTSAPPIPEAASQPESEVVPERQSEIRVEPTAAPTPQVIEPESDLAVPHMDAQQAQPRPESLDQCMPQMEAPKSQAQVTAEAEKEKKRQNMFERTIWTLIMIGGFVGMSRFLCPMIGAYITAKGLLLLGHVYMILLVMLCQTLVYREVTALFSLATTESESRGRGAVKTRDPWSKTLNWYFFAVTNYFLYGESIIYYFKVRQLTSAPPTRH